MFLYFVFLIKTEMEETSGARVCIYIPRAQVRWMYDEAYKGAELVKSTHRLFLPGKKGTNEDVW